MNLQFTLFGRMCLTALLVGATLTVLAQTAPEATPAPDPAFVPEGNIVTTNVRVRDPVMIKHNDNYYIFHTGRGVSALRSADMRSWQRMASPITPQAWHKEDIPEQDGSLWAPDIHFRDGKYHLYYSVSAWMNFNSSIGYATNTTLDPGDPQYRWEDQGKVISFRNGGEGVNVIDPNVFVDTDKSVWLVYGSYKAGLRLSQLNPATGKLLDETNAGVTVLTTSLGEGVFLLKSKDGYYYLFASRGKCCAGLESTYQVVMGRSRNIRGPYLSKTGESWVNNRYSLLMAGDYSEPGRGHNGFYTEGDTTYIVYHAYNREANGTSLLRISPLYIGQDGWPSVRNTGKLFQRMH